MVRKIPEWIRGCTREHTRKSLGSWDGERGWHEAEILDRRWEGALLSWNTPAAAAAATRSPAFHHQAALTLTHPPPTFGAPLSFMCWNFSSDEPNGTFQEVILTFYQQFIPFSSVSKIIENKWTYFCTNCDGISKGTLVTLSTDNMHKKLQYSAFVLILLAQL